MEGTGVPPPWTVACEAVVWVSRPRVRSRRVTALVGGVVRYSETPVGPYGEVVLAVGGLDRGGLVGSVPFMAVDSAASLVAGRVNWGLPKTLGAVEGALRSGSLTASGADGAPWRLSATPRALGPALPVRARATLRQQTGAAVLATRVTATGRLRPALVRVTVEADGPLAGLLRPGPHLGAVLTEVTMTIGVPSRVAHSSWESASRTPPWNVG